jgi:hypothetical protein
MMNRNYKHHLVMVALLLLALIVSFVCNGCAVETDAVAMETKERFTEEWAGRNISILTDNETGVQYLVYSEYTNYGRGVGITRLEDE